MRNLKITLILLLLAGSHQLYAQVGQTTISSPDGHIAVKLSVKDQQLYYQVAFNHKTVVEPSVLGLTVNNNAVSAAPALGAIKKTVINETYAWRGVHSKAVNYCTDVVADVKSTGAPFKLEIRVFNNGVAFRYLLPSKGDSEINADNTAFTIPAGSTVWSQSDIHNYEGRYQEQTIENVKNGDLVGPPLTIKLPNDLGYAAITEGGVTDFAGMSLKSIGNRTYVANLTGTVRLNGNIQTPWRIIEIGKSLNTLVNCDIIANVSPKPDKTLFPKGFATDWIKPGKSVWSWLAGNGGVTFENMKNYSKWAGELGIEYNLVDEGWSRWQDGDKDKWALLKELVDYSNQQHVKVWVWKAYPNRNGVPGLNNPKARWEFFKQCKAVGVVGLKIDFFDTESQEVLSFYQAALKDAAKLHLMLDFHGADKPTGQSRTWPNEMSREGIRGLENKTSWPKHNVTLPFTRYLAGHGDYTPFSFRQNLIKGTTLTHQLATVLTFTSPFMCLAVNPEELLALPVKDMIVSMPTTWDETIVLPPSEIGQISVYARRKGTTWYLAAVNGEDVKDLEINLSFLGKSHYRTTVMEDYKDTPEKALATNKKYTGTNKITVSLQSGGGFVARFTRSN